MQVRVTPPIPSPLWFCVSVASRDGAGGIDPEGQPGTGACAGLPSASLHLAPYLKSSCLPLSPDWHLLA